MRRTDAILRVWRLLAPFVASVTLALAVWKRWAVGARASVRLHSNFPGCPRSGASATPQFASATSIGTSSVLLRSAGGKSHSILDFRNSLAQSGYRRQAEVRFLKISSTFWATAHVLPLGLPSSRNFGLSGDTRRVTAIDGNLEDFRAVERGVVGWEVDKIIPLGAQRLEASATVTPPPTMKTNVRGSDRNL